MRSGPLLLGPAPDAESIYGVVPAVVSAARKAGVGTVLLDAAGDLNGLEPGGDLVIVHLWRAGEETDVIRRCATSAGIGATGVGIPVIPRWTAESKWLATFLRDVRATGATFIAIFALDLEGPARAALLQDVETIGPAETGMFDLIFHGGFDAEVAAARVRIEEAVRAAGLELGVPFPRGTGEHASNLAARQAIEWAAAASADPSASELRRAARRIEDYRGDIGTLFREGNGRLVVEPDSAAWQLVLEALAGDGR